jgi:hypothetical protein
MSRRRQSDLEFILNAITFGLFLLTGLGLVRMIAAITDHDWWQAVLSGAATVLVFRWCAEAAGRTGRAMRSKE